VQHGNIILQEEYDYKKILHDIGIANQIGKYSGVVEVASSGRSYFSLEYLALQTNDGHLPESFAEQAEQAWNNVLPYTRTRRLGAAELGQGVSVSGATR